MGKGLPRRCLNLNFIEIISLLSHAPLRKENNCLNCGAVIYGPYCHLCGQRNNEPKETVWQLITHFFEDITHYDGRFFSSMRYLLFRPGFLSAEYLRGRRASYLNPVRMYVFSSFVFFLVFFSLFSPNDKKVKELDSEIEKSGKSDVKANIDLVSGNITIDGRKVGTVRNMGQINKHLIDSIYNQNKDSVVLGKQSAERKKITPLVWGNRNYHSKQEYDSVQKTLPPAERDNFIGRLVNKKNIELADQYSDNRAALMLKLEEKFLHYLPTLFFVSLPFFAFFLRLLYWRKKDVLYVNHAIFSIHYYIFCFILLLVYFGLMKLDTLLPFAGWSWAIFLIWVLIYFYLYKCMRNFYQQERMKTVLKFCLLLLLFFVLLAFLFLVFIFLSIFNI